MRKTVFLKTVLPLILQVNEEIAALRSRADHAAEAGREIRATLGPLAGAARRLGIGLVLAQAGFDVRVAATRLAGRAATCSAAAVWIVELTTAVALAVALE